MEELARLLARERLLLQRLLFKLVELRAMLATGETRFLPWAALEVDNATALLREAELQRALLVSGIAARGGFDDSTLSLRLLAGSTPQPYAAIFADHRRELRTLSAEVLACVASCSAFAGTGASTVVAALDRIVLESDQPPRSPALLTMVPAASYAIDVS